MGDGVVLKVEPFQSWQVEEGLPFKDEEAVVAQVKRLQSPTELPSIVSDVVHFVPGQ